MTPVQAALFDAEVHAGRSRVTDPMTALTAGRTARVNIQKAKILDELARCGALTADQLGVAIGVHRSTVSSRLAQMRNTDRTVAVCGVAPGLTGRDVQLWRLA